MNLLRVSSVESSRYSQWQQPSDEQINWKKMKKFYNSHYLPKSKGRPAEDDWIAICA